MSLFEDSMRLEAAEQRLERLGIRVEQTPTPCVFRINGRDVEMIDVVALAEGTWEPPRL